MEYQINLGMWQSVFAVPTEIVDQHLKLAGAAQLKVLLWFLRYAGQPFTVETIAESLSMQTADVRDCMQYWVQTGVIAVRDGQITPTASAPEPTAAVSQPQSVLTVQTAEPIATTAEPTVSENISAVPTPAEQSKEQPTQPSRVLSRPQKPEPKYIAQRMAEDESIQYLMQTADEIFGRMTSNNDKATLLIIHEHDGLPVEVIIMLLQYAYSIGKNNMRYIEKMAITWADEEITTLEAAEKKIARLTGGREAAKKVQRILGLDEHSPTEKEIQVADTWLNEWKFSEDMVRKAYETCVDIKGKYIPNYVNSILGRWNRSGIVTVQQVDDEKKSKQKPKKTEVYEPTYDMTAYENSSMNNDEEW